MCFLCYRLCNHWSTCCIPPNNPRNLILFLILLMRQLKYRVAASSITSFVQEEKQGLEHKSFDTKTMMPKEKTPFDSEQQSIFKNTFSIHYSCVLEILKIENVKNQSLFQKLQQRVIREMSLREYLGESKGLNFFAMFYFNLVILYIYTMLYIFPYYFSSSIFLFSDTLNRQTHEVIRKAR